MKVFQTKSQTITQTNKQNKMQTQIQDYITEFKANLQKKILALDFQHPQDKQKAQELLEYIHEYPSCPPLQEQEVQQTPITNSKTTTKPKKTKTTLELKNRCVAKLSNGGQCSRQSLKDGTLCGSHVSIQPYGMISTSEIKDGKEIVSHEVFAVEIQGLVYYIDHLGNVFRTEDILLNAVNPAIIAKYVKTDSGYTIPSLGLM